jgi:putative hemolysin
MNEEAYEPLPEALAKLDYPGHLEQVPRWQSEDAKYRCRFANSMEDLEAVLRLRYRVFNLELNEGLEESHDTGIDLDEYDAQCHHLMVEHAATGTVVGTYRLQTYPMARSGVGYYSADEFHLEQWPEEILASATECGRACIEQHHRQRSVLLLLWKGLGAYVLHNEDRYFFGCCSLTSQDPQEASRTLEYLRQHGHIHPELTLDPRPAFDCHEAEYSTTGWEEVRLPTLFRTYIRYGAMIVGRPALDRAFKTIDFLALMDLEAVDPVRILRQFQVDLNHRP